jgi:hypothetical protein
MRSTTINPISALTSIDAGYLPLTALSFSLEHLIEAVRNLN